MKQILQFQHAIVDRQNPADPHCKAAGDINGDGYVDLLAASASGGGLYWYQYPEWTKHRIAEGAFTTDMKVAELSRKGCLDVVIPSDEGLICYVNPLGRGGDPTVDPWLAINVSPDGARMHDVEVADLNGNGKLDLVTRHQSGFGKRLGNEIHLWVQEALDTWHHRTLPCPHGEGLQVADLNGNGRMDVVIGGRWYENPGDVLGGEWVEHLYMPSERFGRQWTHGDVVVRAGDLTGDGRLEIVLSPAEGSGRLSWFSTPRDPTEANWVEQVIDPGLDHAHGLRLGDMDGDGALDIVVAKMHQATAPQEVAVYLNRGHGAAWDKHVVATSGSHNIALVDVGNTGRLDIYGANWNNRAPTGGAIELWLNQGWG
jgi:hypothetical protein